MLIELRDKTVQEEESLVGWNCYRLTNFNKIREGEAVIRLVRD